MKKCCKGYGIRNLKNINDKEFGNKLVKSAIKKSKKGVK